MLKYCKEFLIYADRKMFKQTLEFEESFGEEFALKYFNSNLNSYLVDECGYTEELYHYFKKDPSVADRYFNSLIKYKDDKIEVWVTKFDESEYGRTEIELKFHKGCSKQFKRKFLKANGFPVKTQHYRIYSDYDCTGQLHTEYVDFKKNIYSLTRCYDV